MSRADGQLYKLTASQSNHNLQGFVVLSNLVLSCTQEIKRLPALHGPNIPYHIDKISPPQLIIKEETYVLVCYAGLLSWVVQSRSFEATYRLHPQG